MTHVTEKVKFSWFSLFPFQFVAPVASGHTLDSAAPLGRRAVVGAGLLPGFPFLTPGPRHRDLPVCLWEGVAPGTCRGGMGGAFLTLAPSSA